MPKFKPSKESVLPPSRTVVTLRYISRAADQLAEEAEQGELPSWVNVRISQAAALMGTAFSYVQHQRKSEQ